MGLEDAVRKVPVTKLIYSKAEALYTKIVERARNKKQLEMKQKLDALEKKRKDETLLEGTQPDRVLGELVDLAIERRVKSGGDAVMDPIETHSSPASDEDGRALAEKASVFCSSCGSCSRPSPSWTKNGVAPGGGSGNNLTNKFPAKGNQNANKGGKGKGKGKFENKGKGKDKGGNVGVSSTASPLVGKGGAKGSPPRQRHHHGVPHSSPSPPRDGSQRSPIKRQWTMAPIWWKKSPSPDRAQGKGGNGGSSGSVNNKKGQRW